VERTRKTRLDIKLNICSENGGEPASVVFCHNLGLKLPVPRAYRQFGGPGGTG